MKMRLLPLGLAMILATSLSAAFVGCSSDDSAVTNPGVDGGQDSTTNPGPTEAQKKAATKAYADVVIANYKDSLEKAKAMQTAIHAFVDGPTEEKFNAAKAAWVAARPSYGETEAFRFYDGPIDTDDREGRINSWPLDENFIDYTFNDDLAKPNYGEPNYEGGIINDKNQLPLTKEKLSELNQPDDKHVHTGWHAIEFLLWGQDLEVLNSGDAGADAGAKKLVPRASGPGQRKFTDYADGQGDAKNQARRREYLKTVTDLLIEDLESVSADWDLSKADSYGSKFVAATGDESLTKIFNGIGNLSVGELANERMNNAYVNFDQEEEHSCFSDTTRADLLANAKGIENVYLGRFGSTDGTGLDELVRAKNPALDANVKTKLVAALAKLDALPQPFDKALPENSPDRSKVKDAIDAVTELGAALTDAAAALGIRTNIE